jgi:hypothetical protein
MLANAIPVKNKTSERLSFDDIPDIRQSKYPAAKLNNAQSTFSVGEDKPFPCGFANGVGKLFPEMPLTKWGTTFVRNAPAQNAFK